MPSISLTFRLATLDDLPVIKRIVNEAYRAEKGSPTWASEHHLLSGNRAEDEHIAEAITQPGSWIILGLFNGTIIASMSIRLEKPDEAYLSMLAVDPQYQGHGLGRQMFAEIERWGVLQGARVSTLQVLIQRNELRTFYERMGYRGTGEVAPFPENFGTPKVAGLMIETMVKELSLSTHASA